MNVNKPSSYRKNHWRGAWVLNVMLASISAAYADDGVNADSTSQAFAKSIHQEQDDKRIQSLPSTPVIQPTLPSITLTQPNHHQAQAHLSDDELANQPQLVVRALSYALLYHNADDVAFLLPYYQNLPSDWQEQMILDWAMGILAEQKGKYAQAIHAYTKALASHGDQSMLRWRLAMALFANKQWRQAHAQFEQLSHEQLPDELTQATQSYLKAIDGIERVQVGGSINIINDKNINNAPKNQDLGDGWTAQSAQSAHGIGYGFDVQKKWLLADGWYADGTADINGKYHTDNKRYNELNAKVATALGYQNARANVSLSPFIEKSYHSADSQEQKLQYFSTSYGILAQGSYLWTPKWQTNAYAQFAKQHYTTRTHLDGDSKQFGITQLFIPNSQQYWYVGADYQHNDAKALDDAFVKKGIKAGVGQTWQHGLGVRANVSYAKKTYQGIGFFGKIQQNDEYSISASIWHNKVQYAGIMPRLTWQYQKVDGNLPLYRYDKNHVFIELGRRF